MNMSDNKEISSVGNMDAAFFVSRKELIDWINKRLKLNITKIEQCSNGAIYIQLLDILFPNKSVMHKAKWNAKLEYECILNYKLIQNVFNKLGIKKYMDIEKLIKGKYQDNFEFLQWFKAFFERVADYNNEQIINYDVIERRKVCILGERGDYKLLNNYLPDWAKVDLNTIKEKNIYKENRLSSNLNKKNREPRSSAIQEYANTINAASNTTINSTTTADNSNYSRNYTSNDSTHYSTHYSTTKIANHNANYSSNKKSVKGEKKNTLVNVSNDHNSNSTTYKDVNIPKKQTAISNNINLSKRLSISNKNKSQDSFSYHSKVNNLDSHKDITYLIDQNKKLKLQLENKNNEINTLKNKLQDEENENKIVLFQKNFYYNKLRFLELLCNQTNETILPINDIQQIIYARENTYFHQTVSIKEKDNNGDIEPLSGNNDHELNLQNSVNCHTLQYNNQNSADFPTYCS